MSNMSSTAPSSASALMRFAPLLPLALCLMFSWLAWRMLHTTWVTAIEQPAIANRASQLQQRIQNINSGERIPITRFRTGLGKEILVSVMEGTFDSDRGLAPPSDAWRSAPWTDAVLINSVDENQSISGGMSGSVIMGCMPQADAAKLSKLTAGDVFLERCTMKLRDDFRINRIANVAVVTWRSYSDKAPCFDATRVNEQEKYDACIEETVASGLDRTFKDIRGMQTRPPDAIIIPALGTGVGALPKHAFYRALQGVMLKHLGNLPVDELVIHVWRNDRGHQAASFSLSRSIVELEATWREQPALNADLFVLLAGVFAGLSFATAWAQFRGRLLSFRSAPYVAGWAAAAFGTATGGQKLLDQLGTYLPSLKQAPVLFALGVAAVLICGPLMQAGVAYKNTES